MSLRCGLPRDDLLVHRHALLLRHDPVALIFRDVKDRFLSTSAPAKLCGYPPRASVASIRVS
jgi:hypothetical protein